jgi:cell division protein FtsB
MKQKIKNFFAFIGRAWKASTRGKIGVILALFSAFFYLRLFFGTVSIQSFVMDGFRLRKEQAVLAIERNKLDGISQQINLIMDHSPDYVEELAQKYLNLGDPKIRIIKL